MDANTITKIREWLIESQALDELTTIPLTYEQHIDFDLRYRKWMGARESAEEWLRALLDYYDTEQSRLARMQDVFGAAIADVQAKREADSRAP